MIAKVITETTAAKIAHVTKLVGSYLITEQTPTAAVEAKRLINILLTADKILILVMFLEQYIIISINNNKRRQKKRLK